MGKFLSILGSIVMFAGASSASEFHLAIGPISTDLKLESKNKNMNDVKKLDIKKIDIKKIDLKKDGTSLNCGTTDCTSIKKNDPKP